MDKKKFHIEESAKILSVAKDIKVFTSSVLQGKNPYSHDLPFGSLP